jgi:peroxiredoxin
MISQIKHAGIIAAIMIASVLGYTCAYALNPGDHVSDFKLPDTNGDVRELYKLDKSKAIVFMVQMNGCPIVRLAMPTLRAVRDEYRQRGVEFFLLNPNVQDSAASAKAESDDYEFGLPIWLDHTQSVAEMLGVTRTAEVFVVDPKTWRLMYHGPLDDRLSYEAQRPVQHHYLTDALDSVLAGKPVKVATANSAGCLIDFPNRKPT